jgi:hypothetical protein
VNRKNALKTAIKALEKAQGHHLVNAGIYERGLGRHGIFERDYKKCQKYRDAIEIIKQMLETEQ